MLYSGAEISVVPVEVAKHCNPPIQIPTPTPVIGGYDLMRTARLVVDVDNRLVWSRHTQPSDQGWATTTPNPIVPVPNRSVYSGVLMREAPSVQSEFQRVGLLRSPASD